MVVRTFPIRVGGPSGPLPKEISWEDIRQLSGAPAMYEEYTSVTKRLRRVACFDLDSVKIACQYNRPSGLAVMGLDRLDYQNAGVRDPSGLTAHAKDFLEELQLETCVPIEFVGTGFGTFDVVRIAVDNPLLTANV
jgi:adenylosuccinate synthase